jgi:hypothetical protein
MKVSYDPRTDTLSVISRDDAAVAESDEDKPGIILDYDQTGISCRWKFSTLRNASVMRGRSSFTFRNEMTRR